jgi:diguanylate cyclase (GGDEF)-like protein
VVVSVAQRIVIVDDSALNRRMLESLVSELNDVEVFSFGNSAEALERAPALNASLFIVDYRMPAPDGMAMLSAIRSDERIHQTPVVMITSAEEREVCYDALERGASDFLVRPIDPREFTRRIGNLLALEAARREAAAHLRREEEAARLNTARLKLIWRAGTSTSDDERFLRRLVDGASKVIVEGRHCAGVIARVDGDAFEIEIANEVASTTDARVGSRVPIGPHRAALDANTVEAIIDLPPERRGPSNWRALMFAPFQVGRDQYFVGFLSTEPKSSPFSVFDTSFLETIANLCAARLQQRAQFERLQFQTEHDALTAILNRASFRARGFAAMRISSAVGLLVLNLDGFRHTNDSLGQQTGDALLVEVAARLSGIATADETVGRLGGDSFAILIANCHDRAQIQACADRYLQAFGYPFATGDREDRERIALAASIGIALAPGDADGFEILLARADAACHAAKDAGRGRSSFFDLSVEEAFAATRLLQNELQTALTRGEFVLYFQPHVDLATHRIGGAEALIRWQHPERGLIEPNAFIPFAERHGLAGAIGTWVMHETERASREWRRADPNFQVWFNLSAAEMRDATLVPRLLEHGTNLSGLGVEITESVAMQNVVETLSVMEALRNAGVRVALDDFGTGYSSLAHLKRLPIDVVKIDRAFITGLPGDRFDVAIVEAVLSIAQNFGFETLAEGIEEERQAAFLRSAGCSLGQGYLFARPMPAKQFETLLNTRLEGIPS